MHFAPSEFELMAEELLMSDAVIEARCLPFNWFFVCLCTFIYSADKVRDPVILSNCLNSALFENGVICELRFSSSSVDSSVSV